jgi:hypothetical protein
MLSRFAGSARHRMPADEAGACHAKAKAADAPVSQDQPAVRSALILLPRHTRSPQTQRSPRLRACIRGMRDAPIPPASANQSQIQPEPGIAPNQTAVRFINAYMNQYVPEQQPSGDAPPIVKDVQYRYASGPVH